MGRRADPPEVQAAKGHPGKRRSKVERQLEEAMRVAELLAAAPAADGEPLSPPVFLDERSAPALAIWRQLAPELVATGRLTEEDRPVFAQFCVYMGEWVAANDLITAGGVSQRVKTTAGGYMERMRPAYTVRERAFDNCLKLAEHFGLTPLQRYSLFKEQAASRYHMPNAPPPPREPGAGSGPAEPPAEREPDLIGGLDRFDSPPPGSRPN